MEVRFAKSTAILSSGANKCRNLGIMFALMIAGCAIYLLATEYISAKKSKGEVLLFRRGQIPAYNDKVDEETRADDRVNSEALARQKTVPDAPASIQKQTAIFHWVSRLVISSPCHETGSNMCRTVSTTISRSRRSLVDCWTMSTDGSSRVL